MVNEIPSLKAILQLASIPLCTLTVVSPAGSAAWALDDRRSPMSS